MSRQQGREGWSLGHHVLPSACEITQDLGLLLGAGPSLPCPPWYWVYLLSLGRQTRSRKAGEGKSVSSDAPVPLRPAGHRSLPIPEGLHHQVVGGVSQPCSGSVGSGRVLVTKNAFSQNVHNWVMEGWAGSQPSRNEARKKTGSGPKHVLLIRISFAWNFFFNVF